MNLTINGVDLCASYGVVISGGGAYNSAERDITTKDVLGRTGQLMVDNERWLPCELAYSCGVVGAENMDLVRAFIGSLAGQEVKISDSYHPNEYYLAYTNGQIAPKPKVNCNMFDFDLKFTRRPERFLTNAKISYSNSFSAAGTDTIPSFSSNFSAPINLVWEPEAAGTLTLTSGGSVCTITASTAGRIEVDADNWIASVDGTVCAVADLWDATGRNPELSPNGDTLAVSCAGAVSITANPYTI